MRYETDGEITTLYDKKGNSFIIDTDQLTRVLLCNWYIDNKGYVRTASRRFHRIYLHRFILGVDKQVDHINRIKTDNRKSNLRLCTSEENNRNRIYKDSKTGVQGVWIVNKNGKTKYRACVWTKGKRIHLGYFDSLEEAKQVREEKSKELYDCYSPLFSQK